MPRFRTIFLGILFAAAPLCTHAATALLLLQGDFNHDTTPETSRWAVSYTGSQLLTGQDLLLAVFGPAHFDSASGLYITNAKSFADGSTWTINYGDSALDFVQSMTRNGLTLTNNTNFSVRGSSWNYWAANGDSGFVSGDPYAGIVDANGWHSSAVGITSRTLADVSGISFDGWDFGDNGFDPDTFDQFPPLSIAGYSPNTASFSDAGVNQINLAAAPEPGRALLLLTGGMFLAWRRRKTPPLLAS